MKKYSFNVNQNQIKNIKLADVTFNQRGPIELSLRTDVFYDIIGDRKIIFYNNHVLSETQLSWSQALRPN